MLTPDQISQVMSENEFLLVQLQDLNATLLQREAEILKLKEEVFAAAELKSLLDQRLVEFHNMQDQIGVKQRQIEGAFNRIQELEFELAEAASLKKRYNALLGQYTHALARLEETQARLDESKDINPL